MQHTTRLCRLRHSRQGDYLLDKKNFGGIKLPKILSAELPTQIFSVDKTENFELVKIISAENFVRWNFVR